MTEEKANVTRTLDQKRVPYTPHHYARPNDAVGGASVTVFLDRDPASVYETLVIQGVSRQHYVFVIPVLRSLDSKATARAVREKPIEMIPQTRLLPLTGYIHGSCSPMGMKKPFPTVLDGSVEGLDTIVVSAGKIGAQVELAPTALCALVDGTFAPVSE